MSESHLKHSLFQRQPRAVFFKRKPKEQVRTLSISCTVVPVILFELFSQDKCTFLQHCSVHGSLAACTHSKGHGLFSARVFFLLSLSLSHYV